MIEREEYDECLRCGVKHPKDAILYTPDGTTVCCGQATGFKHGVRLRLRK